MIRKATLDDIPLMAKIEMACFHKDRYPIDEENFYELMREPSQLLLVHDSVEHGVNGHLLAEVMSNKTGLSIDSVAVLPEFQNKGIGKDLVRAVLEYAKNRNIPSISLETPEHERDLHDFYESLSFRKVGREENFYGDGGACIIMKLIFMMVLMIAFPRIGSTSHLF
jgi:ribosomal protein S18 acetylase RimI-like enzyme